ncbi:MAG: protein-L-isoaspartate(D-aspartate) O-methyltransferase [Candidatus Anstonellales archaeon]
MNTSDIFYQKRLLMVEKQLKGRDITDEKVLNAMLKIERHKFVPEQYQDFAYIDEPLPIGYGQTISQPYIVALMTQLLELKGDERILEIGTGSGYQAAVLAEIVKEVYTIEIIPQLAHRAEKLLEELGYKNIFVKVGDGYLGWPEYAPFDGIIVTCAPDHIPQPLIEQLKDGGRIVIPVGEIHQELVVVEKQKEKIIKRRVIPVRFVPMIRQEEK